jgi:hypothetical protein
VLSTTLWLALAAAAAPAPADSAAAPGVGAGLRELLDARDPAGYLWPRARAELSEILADRLRTRAALRDTVSALRQTITDTVAVVGARADTLMARVEHLELRETFRREDEPGWLSRFWARWGGANPGGPRRLRRRGGVRRRLISPNSLPKK